MNRRAFLTAGASAVVATALPAEAALHPAERLPDNWTYYGHGCAPKLDKLIITLRAPDSDAQAFELLGWNDLKFDTMTEDQLQKFVEEHSDVVLVANPLDPKDQRVYSLKLELKPHGIVAKI